VGGGVRVFVQTRHANTAQTASCQRPAHGEEAVCGDWGKRVCGVLQMPRGEVGVCLRRE